MTCTPRSSDLLRRADALCKRSFRMHCASHLPPSSAHNAPAQSCPSLMERAFCPASTLKIRRHCSKSWVSIMVLAEANLLVVANRDESPSHLPCRAWPRWPWKPTAHSECPKREALDRRAATRLTRAVPCDGRPTRKQSMVLFSRPVPANRRNVRIVTCIHPQYPAKYR